jgi:hypothetical protein
MIQRNVSKARQAALRIGIKIESPRPHLPVAEQEQTDID